MKGYCYHYAYIGEFRIEWWIADYSCWHIRRGDISLGRLVILW